MRIARGLPVLITAFAFVLVAGPALAQKKPSKRDAAVSACIAEVGKNVPGGEESMQQRIAAWKACMKKHGQRS
jgi:hypothetical protein